ncbi:MAG: dipeptide epimerase [candidate division KSB1 bacterium]|nr:dipeptide epimerase [candidate division KSB1 bacterium]MDZ7333963.1 dipeptide epimerase [candidate division KSB1 bacterium]MDZ7356759.1 dipeptide epimerase [candidate division KSB1 bacterium]MDZ7375381.1 dipeptide epimerase [candidate division KSB1 bacterium]MDZ7399948.1 dipeptide epimerase [candidate division KSB1 bacterium]
MLLSRKQFLKATSQALMGLGLMNISFLKMGRKPKNNATIGGTMLEYKVKQLNLTHTWTISRNSADVKNNVFVRYTRNGVFGIGEAAPNIRYNETPESTIELIQKAIPVVEQFDPWHFVDMGYAIRALAEEQTAAKCAIDIAVMDWVGKSLGVPLYRYFGLDKSKTPITTFSIGIDTPQVMQQKIREAEQFPILKIKVGRDNDEEILNAVRAVTDKPLRVDANEGWKTKEEALEKIHWLEKMGVEFIEQPLPAAMLEETRWLRERVTIPIIADEAVKKAADIPKLATAYDGINIKLMKSGGIQEALRMIWMARSLGMKVMLGCMIESSCAIAAAAHISPLVDYADLDGNLLISNDPFRAVIVDRGRMILPDKPGLGLEGEF